MKTKPYKASADRIEGKKYLAGLANTVKLLWSKACEFDGLPVDAQFATFSDANKYARFYSIAMGQYLEACRQYEAGGYVGIQLAA